MNRACIALLCLLVFSLPLSSSTVAATLSTEEIDAIFKTLESGEVGSDIKKAQQYLDTLRKNISSEDIERGLRLKRVSCWVRDLTQDAAIDDAIRYANEQLELASIQSDIPARADLTLCRGWHSQQKGLVSEAMDDYNHAVALAYQSEDPRLIADTRSVRGGLLSYQGNFADALEDLITAQHMYENLNLPYWATLNLQELATSYRRFGDPDTAIRYYKEVLEKYERKEDVSGVIATKGDIAITYEIMDDQEQALSYYREVLKGWEAQQDKINAAATRVNMSGSLIKLNRIKEAKTNLDAALPYIKPEHPAFYAYMNMFMAQVLLAEGKAADALPLLEAGEESFQQLQNRRGLAELYQVKSQAHAAVNDWANAFYALEIHNTIHAELDSQLQTQRTAEMRTRFDTERIADENRQLIENQQLREKEMEILKENKLLQLTIIVMSIIILVIVSAFAFKQAQRSRMMERLAHTDHLTQLANRRHTYHKGESLFNDASANNPLSVIIFDADHFKAINDFFGHEVGDKALMALAKCSSSQMRRQDLVGRVGGEEFLALLPGTTLTQAMEIAERLRSHVELAELGDIAPELTLSISAGVASLDTQNDKNFSSLLNRADHALYRAKNKGRNRVEADPHHSDTNTDSNSDKNPDTNPSTHA
ncbi:GGDEF domain-containing protein [Shewanella sp. JM162201]|uniref:diguanylate cyclase n=1 Tax=Shewanella jiangmenensis TaxID=2837387 RepID=A0ABS5V2B0_9GAMM|nr:tetratricopeptide repeat-containing diguanylate cyclase [Shewanella jiangmenensis]MBT1444599.1 GGDEF domain-containing protein [Shewanella jiangmenensis]